jgi:hypothetical protein
MAGKTVDLGELLRSFFINLITENQGVTKKNRLSRKGLLADNQK